MAIEIGLKTRLDPTAKLRLQDGGSIKIGRNCRIVAQAVIIASNHGFEDRDVPIRKQPMTAEGIVLEEDVWFGSAVRVVGGCRVHTYTV